MRKGICCIEKRWERIIVSVLLRIRAIRLEHQISRGKTQYSQKGNSPYSPFFSIFFFFPQLCPYLFPSRSILFSLIISESGQSALAVWECNRVCERFLLFFSLSPFRFASALANLNALTNGKCLKYGERKGYELLGNRWKEWGIPSALRMLVWVISVILTKWKKQKDWGIAR